MTAQSSGGGGAPTGSAGGVLAGTYPNPGFASPGVPAELGYVETTTAFSTASVTAVDVPGLSLTVTVGARAILIEAFVWAATTATAGATPLLQLFDTTAGAAIASAEVSLPGTSSAAFLYVRARVNPTPGVRSYKVRALNNGTGGTITLNATTGEAMALQIREV